MNEFMQSKFKQIIIKSTTQDQLYLKNQRGNGKKRSACKKKTILELVTGTQDPKHTYR